MIQVCISEALWFDLQVPSREVRFSSCKALPNHVKYINYTNHFKTLCNSYM